MTIKDVARVANVSIASVSRVMNNKNVSEKVRKDVCSAIEELNYTPNFVARSLKRNSTSTIAMLVSDISNSVFTEMAKSIEDAIGPCGYNLIVCSTDDSPQKEVRYLQLLKERHIDGLILNTTGKNDHYVAELSKTLPIVLSNRQIKDPGFVGDFVDSDNFSGMQSLAKHLIDFGHSRIGIILGPRGLSTSEERYSGYMSSMRQIGISEELLKPYTYEGDFYLNSGYVGIKTLLAVQPRPTAVIISNNKMAIGAMRYLKEQNISVPDEVSIASYGDIENIDILYTKPSIVTLNSYVLGKRIAELLLERIDAKGSIQNREYRYVPMLVPGTAVGRSKNP